jgi:hypothetical protein
MGAQTPQQARALYILSRPLPQLSPRPAQLFPARRDFHPPRAVSHAHRRPTTPAPLDFSPHRHPSPTHRPIFNPAPPVSHPHRHASTPHRRPTTRAPLDFRVRMTICARPGKLHRPTGATPSTPHAAFAIPPEIYSMLRAKFTRLRGVSRRLRVDLRGVFCRSWLVRRPAKRRARL